VKNKPH